MHNAKMSKILVGAMLTGQNAELTKSFGAKNGGNSINAIEL